MADIYIPPENQSRVDIFADGRVKPLTPEERKKDLEGMNLGDAGFQAEQAAVENQKRIKEMEEHTKPHTKRRGRPRKVKVQLPTDAPAEAPPEAKRLKVDLEFLQAIAQTWMQYFNIIEQRSSGDPRLTSPTNGGIDLEYGYKLKDRLTDSGLMPD